MKPVRGEKGYFSRKKRNELIKTILLFAVPVALFVAGYVSTRSRLNLLTVVAVLGMLPASRSLVTLIMYMKSKSISESDYELLKDKVSLYTNSYDNVFTTYETTFEVPSLVIRSGNICGYTSKKYSKSAELEKHLTTCIKKEGYSVNVKIFDQIDSYLSRLESMKKLTETDEDKDRAVLQILFDISL